MEIKVVQTITTGVALGIVYIMCTYTPITRFLTTLTPEMVYARAHSIEREKFGRLYIPGEHLTKEMFNLK